MGDAGFEEKMMQVLRIHPRKLLGGTFQVFFISAARDEDEDEVCFIFTPIWGRFNLTTIFGMG